MSPVKTAFLHYTAPPVVGGVEAVLESHALIFIESGYPVTLIAGRGDTASLPDEAGLVVIPELDTQYPAVLKLSAELEQGRVPAGFDEMRETLVEKLRPVLREFDALIVHNVFSKHFNLPLTAALFQLLEEGHPPRWVAWGHDFTWTSPNSRSRVFPGYPWDLLRTYHPGLRYVTISEQRQ